ncbi:MAG: hypothetical protein P8Z31_09860 [Gammaproteobacteria bacterium]
MEVFETLHEIDEDHLLKRLGPNAEAVVVEMRAVSSKIKDLDKKLSKSQEVIDEFLMGLPNIPHATVPIGKDETP